MLRNLRFLLFRAIKTISTNCVVGGLHLRIRSDIGIVRGFVRYWNLETEERYEQVTRY